MKRKALKFAGAYLSCGALAFAVIFAQPAQALTISTVDNSACHMTDPVAIRCPIVGGSYISNAGGIGRAYFDYTPHNSGQSTLSIGKVTPSGTVYVDSQTYSGTPFVAQDNVVYGNQVNVNLSAWDYFYAYMRGNESVDMSNFYGAGIATK